LGPTPHFGADKGDHGANSLVSGPKMGFPLVSTLTTWRENQQKRIRRGRSAKEYAIVPVDSLETHPRNVNQGDIGAIYESIGANGFYGAIVAQKSTGRILAGNHRYQAAVQGLPGCGASGPGLDETEFGKYDFVICSDVFEHVASPVERSFNSLARLLKPSGVLIVTALYTLAEGTIEHFPTIHEIGLTEINGRPVLVNGCVANSL
jgi:SAM-dependent methyltransferase